MVSLLKNEVHKMKMKKVIAGVAAAALATGMVASLTACSDNKIYVDTNAYFAPFEYYDEDLNIVGVDVEIMNKVGEKLGKEVVFTNTEFGVIIDNVASGKKFDCGAAGITITPEREKQVAFSNPYFTSVQYVILPTAVTMTTNHDDVADVDYVLWEELGGKKIGVQLDTTGDIYVHTEINDINDDNWYDEKYTGQLQGSGATCRGYDSAQLAVDAISAQQVDVVVVDKLPADYIVKNNNGYKCYAIYYPASADEEATADFPTEEKYAICVTKGNTELLNAINEVLAELGEEGINALVSKHLGLN